MFNSKSHFEKVFLEFYNPLCNFVNNLIKDKHAAEDVVQEVFVKLWKINDDIDLIQEIAPYLFKTTKNKALEHLRSQQARTKLNNAIQIEETQSADHDELSKVYIRLEHLYSSLRHLPPKCREVFALHKFNGLTYSEIADSENISVKTVENHMLKAMKILRNHMVKQ